MKYINYLNKENIKNFISKWGFFSLFLFIGLIIFTYPMILNPDIMPGDPCDPKSFTYILEHSYKWLLREPMHSSFVNVPFYYPFEHTLFYSDALIGFMPLYWIIRAFCDNPFSAVQIYLPFLCLFNYSTFYYFLKKQLKFESLFSSIGAFLFAFSLLRYYRLCHLNYFSQFFSVLALIFLFKINKDNSNCKNHIYFALFVVFLATQFWTCFSYGFYFCFVGAFVLLVSMFFKNTREKIISFVKFFYKKILLYSALLIILLGPLAYFYLSVGMIRDMEEVYIYLQPASAWIRSLSILDNLFLGEIIDYRDISSAQELCASMGIITTILAIVGIFKIKNFKYILLCTLFFIFICSVHINGFMFWEIFYNFLPGTQGMRAIIRISLMTLFILPVGICYYLNFLKNKKTKFSFVIMILSIIIILIEQIPYQYDINSPWKTYAWSKSKFMAQVDTYSRLVDKNADATFFDSQYYNDELLPEIVAQDRAIVSKIYANTLGVWVADKTKKQSINGNTGFSFTVELDEYENIQVITVPYDLTKVRLFEDK